MIIQNGKDLLIERERERKTGSRELTYEELQGNAETLSRWLGSKVPSDVAFVLILAPEDSAEIGVTASNTEPEHVERILQKAIKRVKKHRIAGAQ